MALIAVIIADEFRTLKAAILKMSGEIAVLNERLNEAEARADDFEHRARGLNRLSEAEKKITEHDHRFSTMETELKVATANAIMKIADLLRSDGSFSVSCIGAQECVLMALGLVKDTRPPTITEWKNKWLENGRW